MMSFSVNSERVEDGTRVRAFARDGSSWVDEPARWVGLSTTMDGVTFTRRGTHWGVIITIVESSGFIKWQWDNLLCVTSIGK